MESPEINFTQLCCISYVHNMGMLIQIAALTAASCFHANIVVFFNNGKRRVKFYK